jgi:hypothetical protein
VLLRRETQSDCYLFNKASPLGDLKSIAACHPLFFVQPWEFAGHVSMLCRCPTSNLYHLRLRKICTTSIVARASPQALAVEPTSLATVRHILTNLLRTARLAIVEPARPLAHAFVHAIVAWRATTIEDLREIGVGRWGIVVVWSSGGIVSHVLRSCLPVNKSHRELCKVGHLTGEGTDDKCRESDENGETHLVDGSKGVQKTDISVPVSRLQY